MNVDLERKLRHLRLGGFVEALPVRTQEAVHNHLAHVEFLELLVEDELARRRQFLFQRRLKQAQLPQLRTIEGFDWDFNPKLPKALILDLATLRFIPERSGALILGAAGLGKSHICIGIAMRAIEAGYAVLYRSAFDLAEDLAEAAATGTRKELIGRLSGVDLLILEDLGGRRLPATAGEDLLEVFSRRYETGATILTSNRPIEDFGEVLGDNVAAGVLLDRFLHHAEVVQLNRQELPPPRPPAPPGRSHRPGYRGGQGPSNLTGHIGVKAMTHSNTSNTSTACERMSQPTQVAGFDLITGGRF